MQIAIIEMKYMINEMIHAIVELITGMKYRMIEVNHRIVERKYAMI